MNNQAYKLGFRVVGHDVMIWPLAKVVSPDAISIGNSVIIDDFVFLMGGKKTTIGDFVHIASFVSITGGGELIIEDFAGLSGGVRVYTGNEDYTGQYLTNPTVPYPYRIPERSFVHIEKHVIVGSNSVIMPGTIVGEGVAIGANSFVKGKCEPWTIYAGAPAKPIKDRPREHILRLENQLRLELFDQAGKYISTTNRRTSGRSVQE